MGGNHQQQTMSQKTNGGKTSQKNLKSKQDLQFKMKMAEKARSKQRNLLVASALSTNNATTLRKKNTSPTTSRRSNSQNSRSLSKSAKTKSGGRLLTDFQHRLDQLENE